MFELSNATRLLNSFVICWVKQAIIVFVLCV